MATVRPSDTERNFALNVADGVSFSVGSAFVSQAAILPLFVSRFTEAPWVLGLIPAIAVLAGNLPMLWGAAHMAHVRDFWLSFRLLIALPRIALVGLALTPLMPGEWALWGFFGFFAIYWVTLGLQGPIWYEYVGHLVPGDRRGRFFGYRNALGGMGSIAAAAAAAWVLAVVPGPLGFSLCFALGALAVSVGFVCMASVHHDWSEVDRRQAEAEPFWPQAKALMKENASFRNFVVCRWISGGRLIGTAFYAIFAQRAFGLSVAETSLLAIALVYLPSLSGAWWGRLADRWGNTRVQILGGLLAAVSHALLFVPSLPVFALGLVGIGCGSTIFMIVDPKWVLELDPARRGTVATLFFLAMTPVAVGMPLLGGLLAQGLGLELVLLVTGVGWLVSALALAGMTPEDTTEAVREAA